MLQRILRLGLITSIATSLVGCPQQPPEPSEETEIRLTPQEAEQAVDVLVTWLECEECDAGELDAVVKLGDVAVPSLIATLNEGPSPAKREFYRRSLTESYGRLREYSESHPEAEFDMTEQEYIKTYMDNYVALYQVRSVTALAEIGGPKASMALREAQSLSMRDDVVTVLDDSVIKLQTE